MQVPGTLQGAGHRHRGHRPGVCLQELISSVESDEQVREPWGSKDVKEDEPVGQVRGASQGRQRLDWVLKRGH